MTKVYRVTERICREIKMNLKKKCVVSLLARKLFRQFSYIYALSKWDVTGFIV